MTAIAAIDAGLSYHTRTLREPPFDRYFGRLIPLRELSGASLGDLPLLMIPCRTHGARLARVRDQLAEYVEGGGTLVVMGETHPQLFLDGVEFTREKTNYWWWLDPDGQLGVERSALEHPLVSSLKEEDLNWHVHGTLLLSEPSQTLLRWESEAHPGDSVMSLQPRGRGQLLLTTLDPIYHHGSGFMPATTRFLSAFLPALCEFV
ncbi:MAG: hypothetical protein AAF658_04630 [Myxococcota bacterium]